MHKRVNVMLPEETLELIERAAKKGDRTLADIPVNLRVNRQTNCQQEGSMCKYFAIVFFSLLFAFPYAAFAGDRARPDDSSATFDWPRIARDQTRATPGEQIPIRVMCHDPADPAPGTPATQIQAVGPMAALLRVVVTAAANVLPAPPDVV